ITGASRGIGRAICQKIGEQGYIVILIARELDELEHTAELITKFGGKAISYTADLADRTSVLELVKNITTAHNQVDLLANVAAVWHDGQKVLADTDFEEFTTAEVLDTVEVGLMAPILLCHGLIPLMPVGSRIINISGTFENGAKGWLPYYVSKKALENLTVGLAQELKDKGILVNCLSPSDTLTESYIKFFPQYAKEEYCVKPEDIADMVAFLVSRQADNLTGQIIEVKKPGGYRL
ncbi:MAG TPA: SDR family oxidoreductase, partial [Candidatus Wirthbacteria bacterium]|nr:SDR family oxidoreductase [Candidatus Wirthbacteria bacterium]